eukprot:311718-Pyramimonas_sp.AAC.1
MGFAHIQNPAVFVFFIFARGCSKGAPFSGHLWALAMGPVLGHLCAGTHIPKEKHHKGALGGCAGDV